MSTGLAGHFTYSRLLRFTIAPILMMICTSIYGVIDGFFVSNYIGKAPFAAINLILPVDMIAVAVGFMMGEGGNAIISKTMGEGKKALANEYFSLLVFVSTGLGLLLSLLGTLFIPEIAAFLGAEGALWDYCIQYGHVLFAAQVFYVLQNAFQSYFIAAGKPDLSLKVSLLAGLTNAVLDYVFIVALEWGLPGAALATALGQVVGSLVPIVYFVRQNSSLLQLGRPVWHRETVINTLGNGSSEMVSVLSSSVVSVLYNLQLLKFLGENGVAAYGAIMYIGFIFMAMFLGYASGSSPLISFNYGAKNRRELHSLFVKSLQLTLGASLVMTVLSQLAARPMMNMFVGYDAELLEISIHGFRIFTAAFLLMGFNIFASALFTALNNGLISAGLSFARTFCMESVCVLLLPIWLGTDGIWLSLLVAETLSALMGIYIVVRQQKKYGY